MPENFRTILKHLQQLDIDPPHHAFETAWKLIQGQSGNITLAGEANVIPTLVSRNAEEYDSEIKNIFAQLQVYESPDLTAPAFDFAKRLYLQLENGRLFFLLPPFIGQQL
jgi:hypothetical protein